MKKLIYLITVVTVVLLAACGTTGSPMKVANNYLDALEKRNYEEARKYISSGSKYETSFFSDFVKGTFNDYVVVREEVNENTATVYYREVDENDLKVLNMVKEGNRWKVALD